MNNLQHIELMLEYMEESKNSEELLAILDTLATIMVDSDTGYLKSANYSRELTLDKLTLKVVYNAHK